MKLVLQGLCTHDVKVTPLTRDKTVFGVRIITNGVVNQETKVTGRIEIRGAIAEMLRMEDKCGNISKMASASRNRNFCRRRQ